MLVKSIDVCCEVCGSSVLTYVNEVCRSDVLTYAMKYVGQVY